MNNNENVLENTQMDDAVEIPVTNMVPPYSEKAKSMEMPDGSPEESTDEQPITGAKKVIFDAEKIDVDACEENAPTDHKEVIFDAEEEIKKKEFENRGMSSEEAKKIMEENPELNPDDFNPNEYRIDENQKNVFDNGLEGGKFIPRHHCPMCMFGKKNITELYAKKRFSLKKRVIGYMSVCANCGHVDFYTNQPIDLLKYLRGKIKY